MEMEGEEKLQFSWNVLLCYYEDTGRQVPQCLSSSIRECTRQLSSYDFDIFTQFFNHGDNFCFYRESKEWQAKTELSIHRLEDTTQETIQLLYNHLFTLTIETTLLRRKKSFFPYKVKTWPCTRLHFCKARKCFRSFHRLRLSLRLFT